MAVTEYSPSGKLVCQSSGPLDAKIVLIGESPAGEEMVHKPFPTPLVGPSGRLLNKALVHAGIDRSQCYVMNLVPIRAPGDKFASHLDVDVQWGRERFRQELSRLPQARVYVALGANPTEWLLGGKPPVAQRGEKTREGFIGAWRGSVIPVNAFKLDVKYDGPAMRPEDYLRRIDLSPPSVLNAGAYVIPTFHPAAVLRQFTWHPWFLQDIARVAEVATKGVPDTVYRTWYRNDPNALMTLANSGVDLISIDSELDPWIVSVAVEDEVHVFEWDERYRRALMKLVTNAKVVKIAHRWLHDFAFFRKCLEIDVEKPLFDSVGGAHILNTAQEKSLSPHISTKFTWWPYHKWLTNVDQLLYCGMDSIVAYDAYWPMIDQLLQRKLTEVAVHDHRLFTPLLHMQAKGFKIDEGERVKVEGELEKGLRVAEASLSLDIAPIVDKELKHFKKPHLFRVERKCDCCGGGTKQRTHCWSCSTWSRDHETASPACAKTLGFKSLKAWTETWPACVKCSGTGKAAKSLTFNPDSPDQLADVIYRGLHIRPRKFKGKETIKAAQLDPIKDKHPIIAKVVELSEIRADFDTVHRLHAGQDGCLHCEFDPWGTGSGRVAGKEGLLEPGTNPMNLPKAARRFVVPRDGYLFIYPDMAQIEARAMAVLSNDKNLRKALYEPVASRGNKPDYHTWLLDAIHAYDPRIALSRDQSKRVSYAGFYGARAEQLAKELTAEAFRKGTGMTVDAKMAQVILDTLYRVCPEVPRWQQSACDEVLRSRKLKSPTGRVFTWTGYIADTDKPGELDYEIKKQVWSRLPQDMGAWVLGEGLCDLYYNSGEWGRLVTPLIHVHDALLIEVPVDRVQEAEGLAVKTLTRYIWSMDFPAEVKKGTNGINWLEVS